MEITKQQLILLIQELVRLEIQVEKKIRKLKDGMGMSKRHNHRIHKGRHLHMEIGEAIAFLKSGHIESALDKVYDLTNLGIKIKSVSFPQKHKTYREIRFENIKRNPEQLIKRSKSHGGGYRK